MEQFNTHPNTYLGGAGQQVCRSFQALLGKS